MNGLAPAEATHAAPISAIEAVCVGLSLPRIMSAMLRATVLPIIAEGMPVRGGAAKIGVPRGLIVRPRDGVRRSERDARGEQILVRGALVVPRPIARPPLLVGLLRYSPRRLS